MRQLADAERIRRLMRRLGQDAQGNAWLHFTGGATAVLEGWRSSTIDVDILILPENDHLIRALPAIMEGFRVPEIAGASRGIGTRQVTRT